MLPELVRSQVARFLPVYKVDICFLRLPPGFPAMPQYPPRVRWPHLFKERLNNIMITE